MAIQALQARQLLQVDDNSKSIITDTQNFSVCFSLFLSFVQINLNQAIFII